MTISNPLFSNSSVLKPVKLGHNKSHGDKDSNLSLMIAATGVVFGDIGTSPLYALKVCFKHHEYISPYIAADVYGVISMMFWALMLVVSLKYTLFVMRANNLGEGGVLSLMALAMRGYKTGSKRSLTLMMLGIFGACMFYGDAVITPAISVISAVEGIEVVSSKFISYVIPITIIIIIGLFLFQKVGTAVVGVIFGPIMLLWFFLLAIMGVSNILQAPEILQAISPIYAINFVYKHALESFFILGGVFLVLTGAEALYADMGHFGAKPIRLAWFLFAMPALLLNYFGQGAMLLTNPAAISNPFFLMVPENFTLILVLIATLVTVIASQAVISGAYSMTNQAIMLGLLPRMRIIYTSVREMGQIYIPLINWLLLFWVLLIVLIFKSSDSLAAAYGIAVATTMITTTLLVSVVMVSVWQWNRFLVFCLISILLIIDISFYVANLLKIMDGGWFPLLLGVTCFFLIMTWYRGRYLLRQQAKVNGTLLVPFVEQLLQDQPYRVNGTAIFLSSHIDYVPVAMLHNLKHNQILHKRIFFLKISIWDVPYVSDKDRVSTKSIGTQIYVVRAVCGFKEIIDIKHILKLIEKQIASEFNLLDTSFFIAKDIIIPAPSSGMIAWRTNLFSWMYRNAAKPSDFFQIPANRVIEMGSKVEI